MYLYIAFIFIISWGLHPIIVRRYSAKTANILTLLILFPVCVFAMGLRDMNVGVDTKSYAILFDQCIHSSWGNLIFNNGGDDTVELGFRLLMKLCGEVSNSYYFYQVIYSSLYILLAFIFIYKYSDDMLLTCAIFLGGGLFMQPFNIARQMFAVIIIAYAIINLTEKKWINTILIILLAALFHKTSLISIVLILYYPLKNNLLIARLLPFIFIVFLRIINEDMIAVIVSSLLDERYVLYVMNDYSRPNTGIILKMLWLINIALGIGVLWSKRSNGILRLYALGSLIAGGCFWIGLSVNFVDRLGLYFLPCVLLLYDRIGAKINKQSWQLLYQNGVIALYMIYFIYWTEVNTAVEYSTIV